MNKNTILFLIVNIFTLVIFAPWLIGHYATDTYNIMNVGYEHYSIYNSLIDGRIFMFCIMQLAEAINIKCEVLSTILLFLSLVVSNISVLIIKNIVIENISSKTIKAEVFSYIIGFCLIYNFMYIENLYFLECFVMAISILISLIASRIFVERKQYYLPKTFLLLLMGIFCYQGTVSSFFIFTILFILIGKYDMKESLKKLLLAIAILGIVCIANLLFVKVISNCIGLSQNRISNNLIQNILDILYTKLNTLIYTSNNFYAGMFIAFLIIILSLILILTLYNKQEIKRLTFLMLGAIFCVDLPYIVSSTVFLAGRTRFAIGALCSILIIYILGKLKENEQTSTKKMEKFIYGIVIIYFIINVFNYVEIIVNTKIVNKCEKEYVENMDKYIVEYENENNVKIEKIQLVYDSRANNNFYGICTRKNVMTWNACSCYWSAIGVINFYTNRKLLPISEDYIQMSMDKMYQINEDVLYVKIGVI